MAVRLTIRALTLVSNNAEKRCHQIVSYILARAQPSGNVGHFVALIRFLNALLINIGSLCLLGHADNRGLALRPHCSFLHTL